MKLTGKIGEIPLIVLIDSGASHNFISPEVVAGLELKIEIDHQIRVKLGDGHHVRTQGRCPVIQVQFGEFEVIVEAFVMELGGIDLIMGVRWLETLGKVIMDWKEMTMSFVRDGKRVVLQHSDLTQSDEEVVIEPEALGRIVGQRLQLMDGLLWTLEGTEHREMAEKLIGVQKREMKALLGDFTEIF